MVRGIVGSAWPGSGTQAAYRLQYTVKDGGRESPAVNHFQLGSRVTAHPNRPSGERIPARVFWRRHIFCRWAQVRLRAHAGKNALTGSVPPIGAFDWAAATGFLRGTSTMGRFGHVLVDIAPVMERPIPKELP